MKNVKAIKPITHKYPTQGSEPVLVQGNDFNNWICKYKDVNKLFSELLASEFARLWEIKVPDTALVWIDYDLCVKDFDNKKGLERRFFERECFGSLFLKEAIDVNQTLVSSKEFTKKIKNKEDLLKIALFDIWLSNEDRNSNNYNLLLESGTSGYTIMYVIDHADIFNSALAYKYDIYEINQDDTILNSTLANLLLKNNTKIVNNVDFLLNSFSDLANKCNENLDPILKKVPPKWNIDLEAYRDKIQFIFSSDWLERCNKLFRSYTQEFIIQKR